MCLYKEFAGVVLRPQFQRIKLNFADVSKKIPTIRSENAPSVLCRKLNYQLFAIVFTFKIIVNHFSGYSSD